MSGIGGVIGSVVGWLGFQMGLMEDVASSTGSLHAKVADVKDSVVLKSNVSVQRGITTLSGSSGTTNVTISSVDTSKTFINISYSGKPDGSGADPVVALGHKGLVYGTLTSGTNLRLVREAYSSNTSSYPINVAWEVITLA